MGKFGKLIGGFLALLIVAVGGLSLLVRFYLTDERVRQFVVPPAEQALGRKVAIGAISVGLFSGITIDDFAIKEANGTTDFVSAKAFVLRYNLLPLLQKKVELSEMRLEKPTVSVVRGTDGRFNFESLSILKKDTTAQPASSSTAPAAGLPVALMVDQIRIVDAAFSLKDATGEMPSVDARADLAMNVSLGQNLSSLRYTGTLDLNGKAVQGDFTPAINGRISFDENTLTPAIDLAIGDEKAHLAGSVTGYRANPKVIVDITSQQLNVDKLLAMAASLPKGKDKPATPKTKPANAPAAEIPAGLEVTGSVTVTKALYQNITMTDLKLRYRLTGGILKVEEMGASAWGGRMESTAQVDLNTPDLAYKGDLRLSSMQADQLTNAFAKTATRFLTGSLASSLRFQGSGTAWEAIKRTLTADGDFALSNGSVQQNDTTSAIADLLGLAELKTIAFKDLAGTFKIVEGGKVQLDTAMSAADLTATTKGTISLDGGLDLPLSLTLAPNLSQKLTSKLAAAKYLTDDQGNTVLNLKLAGSLDSPKPTLDTAGVQKQAEQAVKSKIMEKIGGALGGGSSDAGGSESPASNLLKGLFGK